MAEIGTAFVNIQGDFSTLNKQMAGLNTKFGKLGKGLAAGVGAAAGVAAAGKAVYDLGAQFDDAYDKIRVGTGKTGKSLKGLQGDMKAVFKSTPTDLGKASEAVTGLNQRLGLSGKPLQGMSKRILELSRMTGTDLNSNIKSVSRTMGDWGVSVKGQGPALDMMFRASQKTGIGVDKLGSQMVKFGAPLRQLGFGFDETAALLGKFEEEGVNSELVMGSMRIALGKMAKDGIKDPVQGLQKLTGEIKNAGTAGQANELAIKAFGARAGPDMAAAIREGRFELGDLHKQIAGGKETILGASKDTQDFSEKWQVLKNRVLVGLEPIASRLFNAIGGGMDLAARHAPGLLSAVQSIRNAISGWVSKNKADLAAIGKAFAAAFGFIKDVAARVWPAIKQIVQGGLQIIRGIVQTFGSLLRGDFSGVWNGLKTIVSGALKAAAGIVRAMTAPFREAASRLGSAIGRGLRSAAGAIAGAAKAVAQAGVTALRGFAGAHVSAGKHLIEALVRGVRTTIGAARSAVTALGRGIVEPLHNLGKRFLELGKNLIQGLVDGIRSKVEGAVGAVRDLGEKLIGGAEKILEVFSPSKAFRRIGEFVVKGLILGLGSNPKGVAAAMHKGLLFPLEGKIAELEKLRERVSAQLDRAVARRDSLKSRTTGSGARTGARGTGSKGGAATTGGFANVVELGRALQRQGYQVGEHPAFGRVGRHDPDGYHPKGMAIDVNADGRGQAYENQRLDSLYRQLKGMPGVVELLWRTKGHFDHLHVALKPTAKAAKAVVASFTGKNGATATASRKTNKLSANQIRALAYQAGFRGNALDTAVAIALAESRGRTGASNTNSNGSIDRGLWQINSVHGSKSTFDPVANAKNAFDLYKRRGGFQDWATYNTGAYKQHMGNTGSGQGAAGGVAGTSKALTAANAQVAKLKKQLGKIDVDIRVANQLKTWKAAIDGVAESLRGKAREAMDAFHEKWENTVGKDLDKAASAVLELFDVETVRMVENGPAAQALKALQSEAEAIALAAEDARNQEALSEALAAGDTRQIDAARAQIAETARQRAITAAQVAAEGERDRIIKARDDERKRLEDKQAADRIKQYADDSTAFETELNRKLTAEYEQLKGRKQNYGQFVLDVNRILSTVDLGFGDISAEVEAALSAGPGKLGPKIKRPAEVDLGGAATKHGSAAAGYNAGLRSSPLFTIENMNVTDAFDEELLARRLAWRIETAPA